ncbi:RNA-directed DNA polymerase, eukaryota [Tanacetum coccineum]
MGGLWLWIEFSSDESRLKFQKNTEMELYFTQRKLVSHNFIPDERMIWIEIDGLPLNAWTTNAFKKIAGNWGETVFVDEDADENIANGRVCIKTKIKTHIMDSCLVSIKGVRYQVRVREFANWVPDFASLDNISQHDYESEASGNDQDIHSINESQEEGEINDKKEQMGYEITSDIKKTDPNNPGKFGGSLFEEGEIICESY